MKKKFFGTDGIRGVFNEFPITPTFFYNLTKAIKLTFSNVKKVLIGMDTRESSQSIESDIIFGFKKVKVECNSLGVVSTPILSFNTKKFNYDLGIMISASHNPYMDNGIKIFDKKGEKLCDNDELKIEKNINFTKHNYEKTFKVKKNNVSHMEYENFLFERFSILKSFKKKILFDCANGSLSSIAPNIFRKLNLNFSCYGVKPNGKNINKNCGATFPQEISNRTLKKKADIGVSFDGDADRVIFCDEKGEIVDGDYILAILALFYKNKKKLINDSVVSTKMSNLGMRNFFSKEKIKFYLSDVGDRYVVELMKKNRCILGGEQSGHIIFSDNSFCGDGLFTALTILEIINESNSSLSDLHENLFDKFPQQLVNYRVSIDPNIVIQDRKINALLNNYSKINNCDVLLRKSGTENLLRLMVQAESRNLVAEVVKEVLIEIQKLDEKR